MNKQYKILIGIDPGVNTGLAVYDRTAKKLIHVKTTSIVRAQDFIRERFLKELCLNEVLVRFEDARLRKWFGKTGKEKWQGAGSIKRDCQIWEEFLQENCIAYEMVPPKNNKTKLDADTFKKITGWPDSTNEHGRDSGMLVFGF